MSWSLWGVVGLVFVWLFCFFFPFYVSCWGVLVGQGVGYLVFVCSLVGWVSGLGLFLLVFCVQFGVSFILLGYLSGLGQFFFLLSQSNQSSCSLVEDSHGERGLGIHSEVRRCLMVLMRCGCQSAGILFHNAEIL